MMKKSTLLYALLFYFLFIGWAITPAQAHIGEPCPHKNLTHQHCDGSGGVRTLEDLNCTADQIPKFDGAQWVCGADVDTDTNTNAATICMGGKVLNGNGECVDFDALQAQINALQTQVDALEANKADQTQIDDLQTQITALEGRVDALEQAANRLAVYDAIGNKVGELIDGLVSGHPIVVFQEGGIKIPLAVRENGFPIGGTQKLLFTTADCTGQAYIKTNSFFEIVSVIIAPDTLWVGDRTQSFMSIMPGSILKPDGICEPTPLPNSDTVLPALELADLGVFTTPFTIR